MLVFHSGEREQTYPSVFCVSVWLSEDLASPWVMSSWGLNCWVRVVAQIMVQWMSECLVLFFLRYLGLDPAGFFKNIWGEKSPCLEVVVIKMMWSTVWKILSVQTQPNWLEIAEGEFSKGRWWLHRELDEENCTFTWAAWAGPVWPEFVFEGQWLMWSHSYSNPNIIIMKTAQFKFLKSKVACWNSAEHPTNSKWNHFFLKKIW